VANLLSCPAADPILPCAHTVEVTAASLYEAVLKLSLRFEAAKWVAGITQGINIKVSVGDVRVEHEVKLAHFINWLDRPGGVSPRQVSERHGIRSILGMPVTRC
jgi:hypothetical protein